MLIYFFFAIGVGGTIGLLVLIAVWMVLRINPVWLQENERASELYKSARRWFAERWQEPGGKLRFATWLTAIVLTLLTVVVPPFRQFTPELVGISLGVIVLDELNQLRQRAEFKQSTIRQMASHSNDFALDAARLVVQNGWHVDGSLKGADLAGANLAGVDLRGANMENVILTRACLQRANLGGANLQGADLAYAELQESRFSESNGEKGVILWTGANLQGANLQGAKLQDALLQFVNLRGANLSVANLHRAVLKGANLQNAYLGAVKLQDADLRGAILQSIALPDAHLEGANLQYANLMDTDLNGFFGLDDINLAKAVYNNNTQWPDGFDPPAQTINWEELSERVGKLWRRNQWNVARWPVR